jgi:hypothetical protein
MKKPTRQILLTALTAGLAVACLAAGICRRHKAYEKGSGDVGLLRFRKISDAQLTIDATFAGVVRRGDKLYSTYDRAQPRGKRMCPS